jgi:hypothetical protein
MYKYFRLSQPHDFEGSTHEVDQVREIAKAFLAKEETVAQRLIRSKQPINIRVELRLMLDRLERWTGWKPHRHIPNFSGPSASVSIVLGV